MERGGNERAPYYRREKGFELTPYPARTYTVFMNVTLSINDDVLLRARAQADRLGTSVNQLVREYLEQLAGKTDPSAVADEFEQLSARSMGNSNGWIFSRDEVHERR